MAYKPQGALFDRAVNAAIMSFLAALRLLPYRARISFGTWLFARTAAPLARYTRRAMANLTRIYPDMGVLERRALARRSVSNAGRMLIENFNGPDFRAHVGSPEFVGPGWPILQQAAQDKRPVLLVSAHFGNYEAFRSGLLHHDIAVGAIYRPMSNAYFNERYVPTIQFAGPVFEQGSGKSSGFFRWLRQGNVGLLLMDVAVMEAPKLPFLGHPAPTSTVPAEAIKRFDGLMIPIFAVRHDNDPTQFTIEVDAPLEGDTGEQMMRGFNAALEDRFARHPEEWFWIHKRWKNV